MLYEVITSLMGAFEYFDACSKGVVEAVGDWPSYWVSKDPAFDFLGSMPYGFTNMDYMLWYYQFGGEELYNEAYGKFGMRYFNLGSTTSESGFRTTEKTGPIRTIADYKGRITSYNVCYTKLLRHVVHVPVCT